MTSSCLLFGAASPSCGQFPFAVTHIISAFKGTLRARRSERPTHNTVESRLDKDTAERYSPSHGLGSEFSGSAGYGDNSLMNADCKIGTLPSTTLGMIRVGS